MIRLLALAMIAIGLRLTAGCGPVVTIQNQTSFPVRAIVIHTGGKDVASPSPGESSSVEVDEGTFTVAVIPDNEWIDYAKTKRKVLNDMLANSDNLSGQQLLAVVAQLKDIAARMKQFEDAAGKGASCSGSASNDHDGLVQVSQGAGGLVAACK
jgi:hypothetical protein